jgi:site-specific recombinase XerD
MKLAAGIDQYVQSKRASGSTFWKGERSLIAFSVQIGDIQLDQIKASNIIIYLDSLAIGTVTWRQKYYLLLRFFDFWSSRGELPPLLLPPPRLAVKQAFVPFIFSRSDLCALLKAARQIKRSSSLIDRRTWCVLIIFLCATGSVLGEVLRLSDRDVDVRNSLITIGRKGTSRFRKIPIGADLQNVLQRYRRWRSRKQLINCHFFVANNDTPLSQDKIKNVFRRTRSVAGIVRHDGSIYQPRLYDLKFTFAVHRITYWIYSGANLDLMLPALAAYMGQVGLGSTERYLALTPERFRKTLNKLSHTQSEAHWRDDSDLMKFLSNL